MKKINVLQVFKDFSGEVMSDGQKPELLLKNVLLTYIASATGLTPSEQTSAYLAGLAIGMGGEETQLEPDQYDVVKKLVDKNIGKMNGVEQEVFTILVSQQAKSMVDGAR